MSTRALWTVWCDGRQPGRPEDGCTSWLGNEDTRGKANKFARTHGWFVAKDKAFCPRCSNALVKAGRGPR